MTIRAISRTLLSIERYYPINRVIPRHTSHNDLLKLRTAAETALTKATLAQDQIDRSTARKNLAKIERLTGTNQ